MELPDEAGHEKGESEGEEGEDEDRYESEAFPELFSGSYIIDGHMDRSAGYAGPLFLPEKGRAVSAVVGEIVMHVP